jgi:hypothetical protein
VSGRPPSSVGGTFRLNGRRSPRWRAVVDTTTVRPAGPAFPPCLRAGAPLQVASARRRREARDTVSHAGRQWEGQDTPYPMPRRRRGGRGAVSRARPASAPGRNSAGKRGRSRPVRSAGFSCAHETHHPGARPAAFHGEYVSLPNVPGRGRAERRPSPRGSGGVALRRRPQGRQLAPPYTPPPRRTADESATAAAKANPVNRAGRAPRPGGGGRERVPACGGQPASAGRRPLQAVTATAYPSPGHGPGTTAGGLAPRVGDGHLPGAMA